MSKIIFKSEQKKNTKPLFIIAQDNSLSISLVNDSIPNVNEFEQTIGLLEQELSPNYEVRQYEFGESTKNKISYSFSDQETNIGEFFNLFKTKLLNKKIQGVVLISDGIFNKGTNPLQDVKQYNFPIYTIAIGDTLIPKDISIGKVYFNKEVFFGNNFPVFVNINADYCKGDTLFIKISEKDSLLKQEQLLISDNAFFEKVAFEFNANKVGAHNYTISISSATKEKNTLNNKKNIVFNVRNDDKKILLVHDVIHPDIASISQVFKRNDGFSITQVSSKEEIDVDSFDLVILYQLPSTTSSSSEILRQVFRQKMPLLLFIGENTSLRKLNQGNLGLNINQKKSLTDEVKGSYNASFSLFKTNNNYESIGSFPPLKVPFGDYSSIFNSHILLYQQVGTNKTTKPLVCFSHNKEQAVAFILGEGFWRWKLNDFLLNNSHDLTDDLVLKVTQYLTSKAKKERLVIEHKVDYLNNENIAIKARLYNASNELIVEPSMEFNVMDENNQIYPYSFTRKENYYQLNMGKLEPGYYKYEAKTKLSGKNLFKEGEFVVSEINIETENLKADHNLLYRMSEITGGRAYYPNELSALISDVNAMETIQEEELVEENKELFSIIAWFFLIGALLFSEWFLRKYWGGV